jgi:hypothetical protein
MVKNLPSKHEAMNSNPSTATRKDLVKTVKMVDVKSKISVTGSYHL